MIKLILKQITKIVKLILKHVTKIISAAIDVAHTADSMKLSLY